MVDRQEVEALLVYANLFRERDLVPMVDSPIVPAPTLAALCRAWLALEDAPRGRVHDQSAKHMDIVSVGGGHFPVEMFDSVVRIVREPGDD